MGLQLEHAISLGSIESRKPAMLAPTHIQTWIEDGSQTQAPELPMRFLSELHYPRRSVSKVKSSWNGVQPPAILH